MEKAKIILEEFNSLIAETFERERLGDYEITYEYCNLLMEIQKKEKKEFNKILNFKDLQKCNNDLAWMIANLFIYRTFINDPTKDGYTYDQNGFDSIYSMYVSCCYEKLYNCWDRIGDMLDYYLDLNIKTVDFHKSIKKISENSSLNNNIDFHFLNEFLENEYRQFNSVRKQVVHYHQYETWYYHKFCECNRDRNEVNKLWTDKSNMPNYFKNHLELLLKGFSHVVKLISNYNKN